MFINGRKVGETKFSQFGHFNTSITETFDTGKDLGSPVSHAYQSPNAFTGRILAVGALVVAVVASTTPNKASIEVTIRMTTSHIGNRR